MDYMIHEKMSDEYSLKNGFWMGLTCIYWYLKSTWTEATIIIKLCTDLDLKLCLATVEWNEFDLWVKNTMVCNTLSSIKFQVTFIELEFMAWRRI